MLKDKADLEKPIEDRDTQTDPDLLKQRHRRKINPEQKKINKEFMKTQRKKAIEVFKKNNWWLTPSQKSYQYQKSILSWLSKSKK